MVCGVIIDPDYGTFEDFRDEAMKSFFVDGIIDLRGMISDRDTIAISWTFSIAEELVKWCSGRIILCDASAYSTGFRDVHLVIDLSKEPIILPAITPAEHISVIINPIADGLPYDAYLLESRDTFHGNKMVGITGICTDSHSEGIDYCIRIVDELKSDEEAVESAVVGSVEKTIRSGHRFDPSEHPN